ncbi:MAG TPA: carboxypeptidase-like regulatory domain-containing protein [Kofleriaceae bacterium]
MRRYGLSVLALAACTYPEKQFAGPYSCLGDPPPSSADPLVTLRGVAVNPSDQMPLAAMSVSLKDRNLNAIDGPITTDATGAFQFSLSTSGIPVDRVYLNATGSGRVPTYYAPPRPLTESLQLGLGVISIMQGESLALGALGMPFTAGTGAVLFTIADCNDKPIASATVTSNPTGAIRYFNGVQPSMTAAATDAGGVAMVANLPPGPVSLTVTVNGMTFPARSFTVVADSFVQTLLTP